MKKANLLKKTGLIMACCAMMSMPFNVNAATTNTKTSTMTTVSGIPVSVRLSTQSKKLFHYSNSNVSVSHKQVVTCKMVLIASGGRTKTGSAKYTCSGYDKKIGATIPVSSFSSEDFTGFYYTGSVVTTFSSIKIPEAKEVSRKLIVSAPKDIV